MQASKLKELFDNFEIYCLEADCNHEVHYGCDCGCGGDTYDSESWDDMLENSDKAYNALKTALESLGVVWDICSD